MWSEAFAQAQGQAGQGDPAMGMLLTVLQFVPIFLIIYFLLIRPQRQKQKALEKMVSELKKGDKVVTSGGIIGTVVGLDDAKAVLKIAENVKVEFTKGSIVQVMTAEASS